MMSVRVWLNDEQIATDLHLKLTDRHQYLHFSSAQPNHTERP